MEKKLRCIKIAGRAVPLGLIAVLLISGIGVGLLAYVWPSVTIPFEVKEPLEILSYPSGFSLFPGETVEFNVTVKNYASVNYSVVLDYRLDDSYYQTNYVRFSDETFNVGSGVQTLTTWLFVEPNAPPTQALLTIDLLRIKPVTLTAPASLVLLGNGARWAAGNGSSALYVNWKDNWLAHHLKDGADWGPWPSESAMDNWRLSISQTLQQCGFKVTFMGDIPESLSGYDLVVIFAYWAVEPQHEPLVRDYLFNGGGVVILAGVPCHFVVSCKDMWAYRFGGTNLSLIQDWFGCRSYVNTGGYANVVVDNPFGTALLTGDTLLFTESHSWAAVTSLNNNTRVIAEWVSGPVFAFTHEYGQGRVYYQAGFENSPAALFEN